MNINEILQAIGTSEYIVDATKKYQLHKSFKDIGDRLNNYVHGNGYDFYNVIINSYESDEIISGLQRILDDINYITVTFLFLLILCSPLYVMSTDYIDYLEFGETPPEGSQYWVAPFVEDYIQQNIQLIDSNCYNYLKDNTCMKFE